MIDNIGHNLDLFPQPARLGRSEQINRFTVPQMAYRSALFHGPIFASCNISMPFMTEE